MHHSAIKMEGRRTLAEEQVVQFDLGEGQKGPQALNVVAV